MASTPLVSGAVNACSTILTVDVYQSLINRKATDAQAVRFGRFMALAVFVIVGSLGPGIPVAIYFFMKDRATELLEDMRDWLAKENATIMSVLCLVIGAKVIGDAISALAA